MDEVNRRWEKLYSENPSCFDGTLLNVLGAQQNGYGGTAI
jgi:hypothetical protein